MKLYKHTVDGFRQKRWTCFGAIAYFIKGAARELDIAPDLFLTFYKKVRKRSIDRKYLKRNGNESYYDFNGIRMPDLATCENEYSNYSYVEYFDDMFLVPCNFGDNYDKSVVNWIDESADEGVYGYTDGAFDVTVKKGDFVIDAGACFGGFSAYAAYKGATAYAFEPVSKSFRIVLKTKELNNINGGG